MSDEAPPAAAPKPAGPPAAKTSKAVLGMIVLNLGITGFVAFKLVTTPPAEAAAPHPAAPAVAPAAGPIVPLDPFIVNLDEPGTSRYLKITLQVQVANPESEAILTKSKEEVRDTILSRLSALHVKDTLGADAKERIRNDLVTAITKRLGPGRVQTVYFQDFVVQ